MTRVELTEEVRCALGISQKESDTIVLTILDSIVRSLRSGEMVEIRGFGSFHTRQRPPRNGRNPRTGAAVKVSATTVAYFKPSKELLARVNRPTIAEIPGTKSEHQ